MDFSAALPEKKKSKEIVPKQAYPLLDLEKAKAKLQPFLGDINSIFEVVKAMVVDNDEKNVEIVSSGTKAMKLYNELIAMKKEHPDYKIAKKFVDNVDDFLKIYTEKLYSTNPKIQTIVSIAKYKNTQYRAFQEQKRREAELAAQKATEEVQKKLNAEAKKTGTAPVQVEMPVIPKQESVTRSETGSAYGRKYWNFKVVDASLVPREYLTVSDTTVRNAIKAGVRQIPGIEIFEEERTSFRT